MPGSKFVLRLRFNGPYIVGFVGNRKLRRLVEASSEESLLRDREGSTCSLDAAELVARALAERMKAKYICKAKFDIKAEYRDKEPRFHNHILTFAEGLSQGGIKLS